MDTVLTVVVDGADEQANVQTSDIQQRDGRIFRKVPSRPTGLMFEVNDSAIPVPSGLTPNLLLIMLPSYYSPIVYCCHAVQLSRFHLNLLALQNWISAYGEGVSQCLWQLSGNSRLSCWVDVAEWLLSVQWNTSFNYSSVRSTRDCKWSEWANVSSAGTE